MTEENDAGFDPEEEFVFEDDESEKTADLSPPAAGAPAAATSVFPWALAVIGFLLFFAALALLLLSGNQGAGGETDFGPLKAALRGDFPEVAGALASSDPEIAKLASRDAQARTELQRLLGDQGEGDWEKFKELADGTPYAGLSFNVSEPDLPPTLGEIVGGTIAAGELLSRHFDAVDPEGGELAAELQNGPQGTRINRDEKGFTVQWDCPDSADGRERFELVVRDSAGNATMLAFSVDIQANLPPIVGTRTLPYRRFIPFTGEIEASDPEGAGLRFELLDGPEGMRLDPSSGMVEWNPGLSGGDHKLRVRITDGTSATDAEITLVEDTRAGNVRVQIESPAEGQVFSERVITLKGSVRSPARVSQLSAILNGLEQRLRLLDGSRFEEKVVLKSGRNELIVKAVSGDDYGAAAVTVRCSVPPSRILATLTWDQEYDADLYVFQPNLETVYYPYKSSALGGILDVDNTEGYGPENYNITGSLPAGDYKIGVNFFSDNRKQFDGRELAQGPLDWHLRVILDEGTDRESIDDYHGTIASVREWSRDDEIELITVAGRRPRAKTKSSLGVRLTGGNKISNPNILWTRAGLPRRGKLRYIQAKDAAGNEAKAVIRDQDDLDMVLRNLDPGAEIIVICDDPNGVTLQKTITLGRGDR